MAGLVLSFTRFFLSNFLDVVDEGLYKLANMMYRIPTANIICHSIAHIGKMVDEVMIFFFSMSIWNE